MPLSAKQQRFVEEYLIDLNGAAAAGRAGYKGKNLNDIAAQLLSKDQLKEAIDAARAERSVRTKITADDVLRHLWQLATADPNELVEFRRRCCRHCHGHGGMYQRTVAEMNRDRAAYRKKAAKAQRENREIEPFDEAGGVGFDHRLPPNPECQECGGDGIGEAFFKDTRHLSAAGKRLYAGVKQTRHGLEIKMHDQHAALVEVGRHVGFFNDSLNVRHSGAVKVLVAEGGFDPDAA